jgi:glycosyltransferase involved in cell wall biosynthesis
VTACSQDLATRAIGLGADPQRLTVIPYGVDAGRFHPDPQQGAATRAALGVPDGGLLVAAAGRLVSKKGFEYLVDAMAAVPGAILAIAGDGTLREALRDRAAAARAEGRVHLLGNRTQDEVATLFAAADVIVAPSIRDDAGNVDGLPNVVMEALASGTPLITTTAGGIGAVVEDDRTALVVAQRDAGDLAAAISRLAHDADLRMRIGSAARALVQQRFGWERTAEQFEQAYVRALAFKATGR